MTTITISNLADLENLIEGMEKKRYNIKGKIFLEINGEFSQLISKTYNAYAIGNRGQMLGYGGAVAGIAGAAVGFAAPTAGLSLLAGGVAAAVGWLAAKNSGEAYESLPLAREVRALNFYGFRNPRNTGEAFYLSRAAGGEGYEGALR